MLSHQQTSKVVRFKLEIKQKKVIRKGLIGLHNGVRFGSKDFWFVLTTDSLSWFKEEDERDRKYTLKLDQLKIKDLEAGLFSKRHTFALFSSDGR